MNHLRDPKAPLPLGGVIADYLATLVERLRAALGDALVGVYLHGSLVLGDFDAARSDVDVVAVCSRPLADEERQTIAARLSSSALPCPATGLELHVVTRRQLRTRSSAPRFELHLTTSACGDRIVEGRASEGDPDLVMHFALLHDHGHALVGPPPAGLFPRPPRDRLLAALAGELRWAEENASPSYQVLNACRAWRFLEEDVLCSKTAGGAWARGRVVDAAPIEAALRHRSGDDDRHPDGATATALLHDVLSRLEPGGLSSRT
jgi:hypothetical protein